jgi:hypothetical protein
MRGARRHRQAERASADDEKVCLDVHGVSPRLAHVTEKWTPVFR